MEKKKKSTLFTRLFGNRNKVTDFMTEEQLQSPGRLILKNFLHNRLGMIGLIVFLLIFLLVMIGPKFYTLDLSYQDNTQLNVPPGMNMMSIPDGMKHKVADISPGTTYGVGVDTDGNVYTWGYTKITETIDLKNIPEEVQNAKIVNVAAGYDHIVALDENGAIYVWGNRRLGQDMLPDKLQMAAAYGKNLGIKQIEASNQFSAAVTEDGELFLWGNGNQADIKIKKEYQGNIEKELPVELSVTYTLDGKSVSPEELAGKSGHVVIRFDYRIPQNRENKERAVNARPHDKGRKRIFYVGIKLPHYEHRQNQGVGYRH